MRLLMLGLASLGAALYGWGSVYFYREERRARTPTEVALDSEPSPHPEAVLGAILIAFARDDYSPEVVPHLSQALEEAPASYQAAFLVAAYHANRLEAPEKTTRGFEAAIARYPANGRLRLSYARWLLGESVGGLPREKRRELALGELEAAFRLEPELTGAGLALLEEDRIPASSWASLLPETVEARRKLLPALVRAGHRGEALALLRRTLAMNDASNDSSFLRDASSWALEWHDPEIALEAATGWQRVERASGTLGVGFARASQQVARVHLERGELDRAYDAFRDAFRSMTEVSGPRDPASLDLLCAMGYEYLRHEQPVMAESLFEEARRAAPYYAPAALGLARTYRKAGERDAAIEQYRKVLSLAPEQEQARKELEELVLERELRGSPESSGEGRRPGALR